MLLCLTLQKYRLNYVDGMIFFLSQSGMALITFIDYYQEDFILAMLKIKYLFSNIQMNNTK